MAKRVQNLDAKKNPHAVALGQRGGKSVAAKHGKRYMANIARRSHEARLLKYGVDYPKRIRRGEKPSQN